MKFLYNDRSLRDRRRELRKNMTDAESKLWGRIRMRNVNGYKFLRQYSVGPYILDFFCVALQLGIEVDGKFHGDAGHAKYDLERSDFLANHGIQLIRFWNDEIIKNIDFVVLNLKEKISEINNSPLEEGEQEGLLSEAGQEGLLG